jgi:hypothetical protein
MKFGVTYNWYQKDVNSSLGNQGGFGFSSTDPSGNNTEYQEFANFLTGNVSNFAQLSRDIQAVVQQQAIEFYAQDQFKILCVKLSAMACAIRSFAGPPVPTAT